MVVGLGVVVVVSSVVVSPRLFGSGGAAGSVEGTSTAGVPLGDPLVLGDDGSSVDDEGGGVNVDADSDSGTGKVVLVTTGGAVDCSTTEVLTLGTGSADCGSTQLS